MDRKTKRKILWVLYVVIALLFAVWLQRAYVIGKNLDAKDRAIATEWCAQRGGELTFQRYPVRTYCIKDGVELAPKYERSEAWIGNTP